MNIDNNRSNKSWMNNGAPLTKRQHSTSGGGDQLWNEVDDTAVHLEMFLYGEWDTEDFQGELGGFRAKEEECGIRVVCTAFGENFEDYYEPSEGDFVTFDSIGRVAMRGETDSVPTSQMRAYWESLRTRKRGL